MAASRDYSAGVYTPATAERQQDGSEFTWQRAAAAASTAPPAAVTPAPSATPTRLAAAAELARRCAELGVQPPLPPVRQVQPLPPAPPPPPPEQQLGMRLDALAQQVQQHSSVLSSAVQGQAAQLAAQQRLLQDVVQGLLFVGAKAGGGAGGSEGRGEGTGAAAPAKAAPHLAARPPRPRSPAPVPAASPELASSAQRTAALVQRLAARLQREPEGASSSSEGDELDDDAAAGRMPAPVAGMLRVPTLQRAGTAGPGRHGRDTLHPALAAAATCSGPRSRPAWNDRTVVQPRPQPRRAVAEYEPVPPLARRSAPGGLGPQLLLNELQRLQRRRSTGGGTGGSPRRTERAPLQQFNRPLMAHPAGSRAEGQGAGRGRLRQRAKEAAVLGKARQQCGEVEPLPSAQPQAEQQQPSPAAAPGPQVASAGGGSASDPQQAAVAEQAGDQRACGPTKKLQPPPPLQMKPPAPVTVVRLGCALQPPVEAPPLLELRDADIDAMCDQLLRELLQSECSLAWGADTAVA